MNDKIYTSVPANKQTAIVVSITDERDLDGEEKWRTYMSLTRPPISNNPFSNKSHDLTGISYSSFKVIGMFVGQNKNKKSKWVVQCKCGYYTIRRGNTIRQKLKSGEPDRCERCMYVRNLTKNNNV